MFSEKILWELRFDRLNHFIFLGGIRFTFNLFSDKYVLPRLLPYSWQNKTVLVQGKPFFKDFGKHGIVDGVLLVIRNQYVDAGKDPNCQVSLELIQ